MFITFSKTIARFGGVNIRVGKRIKASNAWLIIGLFGFFKLIWSLFVLMFWLYYALFYGIWWCCKKIVQSINKYCRRTKSSHSNPSLSLLKTEVKDERIPVRDNHVKKYCPYCGADVKEGSAFCISCGMSLK